MQIILNGQARHVEPGTTLEGLLAQAGYAGRKVAAEVNREVVPRSRHAVHALAEGDRVEIIQAIGGG